MEIILTPAQWADLQTLVIQGRQAVAKLGMPIELKNGDQIIEIKADETKITLTD